MLNGHLSRVIDHQVCKYTKTKGEQPTCRSPENGQSHGRTPVVTVLLCSKSLDSCHGHIFQFLGALHKRAYSVLYTNEFTLDALHKRAYLVLYTNEHTRCFTQTRILGALHKRTCSVLYTKEYSRCFTQTSLIIHAKELGALHKRAWCFTQTSLVLYTNQLGA